MNYEKYITKPLAKIETLQLSDYWEDYSVNGDILSFSIAKMATLTKFELVIK